jgi:hypothetical protein
MELWLEKWLGGNHYKNRELMMGSCWKFCFAIKGYPIRSYGNCLEANI